MKNSIKYLLLAAIAGCSFLKVFSKKNEGPIRDEAPPVQTMPKIPNGDFEDWTNLGRGRYILNVWDNNSSPSSRMKNSYYNVIPDTVTAYQGKYSAKLIDIAYMLNQFPLSVHPSSLHLYMKSQPLNSPAWIKIELLKNGSVVDSGKWNLSYKGIEEWKEIIIPITNRGSAVDSARITIRDGGAKLWMDDLFFK